MSHPEAGDTLLYTQVWNPLVHSYTLTGFSEEEGVIITPLHHWLWQQSVDHPTLTDVRLTDLS